MYSDLFLCNSTDQVSLSKAMTTQAILLLATDLLVTVLTTVGNALFMFALCTDKSLHAPSNALIGLLCASDLLVGFICQPLFLAHLSQLIMEYRIDGTQLNVLFTVLYNGSGVSFFFTILISVDRYLAVCHPFKYHAKATYTKHLLVGISSGCLWTITFGSINYVQDDALVNTYVKITYSISALSVVIFCYASIYRVIRKQRRNVITIGRISRDEIETNVKRKREQDRSKTVAIIIGLIVICYGPFFIVKILGMFQSSFCWNSANDYSKSIWTAFCILLNSLFNPIVYFVRSKEFSSSLRRKFRRCYSQTC
ncbi:trace amine-associated receptor 1-like [Rhopilema esculentum]|uniref:trace amine-associated receptor 1-like n=1 Tax=Rhopilema esculentum TaxID=499914 RepID=UPI0031E44FBC|eukprot:gene14742-5848_t